MRLKERCSNIKFLFLSLFSSNSVFLLFEKEETQKKISILLSSQRGPVSAFCRMANFRRERRAEEMSTCPQEVCLHNRDGVFIYSALSSRQPAW